MVTLNAVEARVVGALMEKEITTPEYYPLSLNALVNACNQKSSREPVMALGEADVRTALFDLDGMGLVRTLADARVSKFEHRMRDALNLRRDEVAVVCLLLLRGPQTAAELRARSERMYSFDDNAAVVATLERLAARDEPLTRPLARGRWAHLLSGAVEEAVVVASVAERTMPPGVGDRLMALEEMVMALEERVRALESSGDADETQIPHSTALRGMTK
jgi:uncharacterized protein YceH (UPF0502 family)